MTDLSSLDYKDNIRQVIKKRLKELGVKVPKSKTLRNDKQTPNGNGLIFGVPLDKLQAKNIGEDYYCWVPSFLVEATEYLENHLGNEGLFRKSGSSGRQKQLRKALEEGAKFADAQSHDVASLLKQFFRELPEPLLTNHLHDSFLKCLLLGRRNEQTMAILLLCIMLPIEHLSTLQYFMRFVAKVASKAEESKMSVSNLAIVLTPNLMNTNNKKDNPGNSEKILKEQTSVIQILLENAQEIGIIAEDIVNEAKNNETATLIDGGLSSGDELDGDKASLRAKHNRTTSISGFVSGFGNKVNKLRNSRTQSMHRRSKSVKAEFSRHKRDVQVDFQSKDDSVIYQKHLETGELSGIVKEGKRKPLDCEVDKDLTPAGKRKMTSKDQIHQCQVISSPFSVTRSTQMFMTPKRPILRPRPLSENVLTAKNIKDDSHETQHVKVVDARNYNSPEHLLPGPISLEFAKLLDNNDTPTGDKYVFDSPLDTVLTSSSHAKMKRSHSKRHGRKRTNRRNSSGATRCFSSPRNRKDKASKSTSSKTSSLVNDDISSTTTEEFLDHDVPTPWCKHLEKGTPRRNTPPVPRLATGKAEFRTIF